MKKAKTDALANRIGLDVEQTEDLLLELIGNGKIKGRLILETGEFVSGMVETSLRLGDTESVKTTCPNCSAQLENTPLGDTLSKCPHCGALLTHS